MSQQFDMNGSRTFAALACHMLQARLFDDFKGAPTLLIWGDSAGMASLLDRLAQLDDGIPEVGVGEGENAVTVSELAQAYGSQVSLNGGLRWACSHDIRRRAADLIASLLKVAGHQYIDAEGEAEQVMVSANEYPADFGE